MRLFLGVPFLFSVRLSLSVFFDLFLFWPWTHLQFSCLSDTAQMDHSSVAQFSLCWTHSLSKWSPYGQTGRLYRPPSLILIHLPSILPSPKSTSIQTNQPLTNQPPFSHPLLRISEGHRLLFGSHDSFPFSYNRCLLFAGSLWRGSSDPGLPCSRSGGSSSNELTSDMRVILDVVSFVIHVLSEPGKWQRGTRTRLLDGLDGGYAE